MTRLVLCSGKVYYDVVGHEARAGARHIAVGRIEQLYPFPVDAVGELIGAYPNLQRDRVGAGGAAEHGRRGARSVTASSVPAGGGAASLRRPAVARVTVGGLPDGAPARAGPDR